MRAPRATAPKILVVDDDDGIREVLTEALAMDGHRVSCAPNGKVALEQALASQPDLIVLDLMMPVMSGWQFLEARRRHRSLAAIPVVVVTAALDPQVDGAAAILRKPFDLDTLSSTIRVLCGREGPSLHESSP